MSFSEQPERQTATGKVEHYAPCVLEPALQGKKVLELGCGHGLPGIICLLAGAQVHFQVGKQGERRAWQIEVC
jgi:16S rRNA G527 N7-methylase RsmG